MTLSPLASGAISGRPFSASTWGSEGTARVRPCPYCGDLGVPLAIPPLRRCPVARTRSRENFACRLFVSFCCRVLSGDGVSVLLGQRPLSKTFHTHREWTKFFQS